MVPYRDVAREAVGRLWRWLTEPRWPEGEPALTADGLRFGTVLPDGTIVLAPGFKIERLPEQQAEATPAHHDKPKRIQDGA